MKDIRADFPEYELNVREIDINPNKVTYGKLTYKAMEDYIVFTKTKGTDVSDDERKVILKGFNSAKAEAAFKKSPYACMKKWFLREYRDFSKKEISTEITENKEVPQSKGDNHNEKRV